MSIKKVMKQIIPENLLNFYHKCQAILANIIYGFPSKNLQIIGVTGTNGKTTTCYMIAKILDEAGCKNAMIGTVFYKIGSHWQKNLSKMTTINPFVLQKFLRAAVNKNCRFVIVETTSHAIIQSRIWGLKFNTLVFTNLTHDHLDYHKTFNNYLNAKLKLFADNPQALAVINADDPHGVDFKKISKKNITYSLEGKGLVCAKKIKAYNDSSTFTIEWLGNQVEAKINIAGFFNVANALAAFCVGANYNISPRAIAETLGKIKSISGRMEYLDFGQDYKIIIDFAHTPDGLQKVFETLKSTIHGKLIHVAGATGDRDRTKRPILGALAGKFADIAIVTDEDPGKERPEDIINKVAEGVERGAPKNNPKILGENFFKIMDRACAIKFALSIAKKNDVVLITGKGHEEVMAVGDKLVPYSDKKVVEEILKK